MKRIIVLVLIVIAAGLAIGWLVIRSDADQNTASLKPIKIGYNAQQSTIVGPIIVAAEKGYFREAGLDAELVPFRSGGEIKQALAGGTVDIASLSTVDLLMSVDKQAPIKAIAFSCFEPHFLYVRPEDQDKPLTFFADKTLATRADGNGGLVFSTALRQLGADVKTMKFLDVDKAARGLALTQNRTVDAATLQYDQRQKMIDAGAVPLKAWLDGGYASAKDPIYTTVTMLLANTDFLAGHADTVSSFIDAIIRAHEYTNADLEAAAQVIGDYTRTSSAGAVDLSVDDIASSWRDNVVNRHIWLDPTTLDGSIQAAYGLGVISREMPATELFDLRYQARLQAAERRIYGQ